MSKNRSCASELYHRTDHLNWAGLELEHGSVAVVDYRHFLVVKVLDDDLGVGTGLRHAPGKTVEAVWHSHLLRPTHYAAVCAALTGSPMVLIDHDPAAAGRMDAAERAVQTAYRVMELFGRPSWAARSKRKSREDREMPLRRPC